MDPTHRVNVLNPPVPAQGAVAQCNNVRRVDKDHRARLHDGQKPKRRNASAMSATGETAAGVIIVVIGVPMLLMSYDRILVTAAWVQAATLG